ncbi:RluA family pseudouridine synthase [Thalassobacillus sp. CUG 92003]|uniref:RluA family pseudouridine synthase n=1 Tax=Thalassobacillus sp. CUG 92003 TaxID=2736641 RepID=UPI0021078912|nr:RluA family pseudouridine synthase [Thalassobacillus sp. CUG 92003]
MSVQGFSYGLLKKVKSSGDLTLNEEPVTVRAVLREGDIVTVQFPPEPRGPRLAPEPMNLDIVYEDKDVLVINKPKGVACVPSADHPNGTLANGVIHYYNQKNLAYTVHIVTRLDRDTSGLMLIAKHQYIHSLLARKQQATINRRYQALVEGMLAEQSDTINAPIARKPGSIIEREVADHGKRAVTHYQVRHEWSDCCLVEVELETGRTHQIRVHMAHIGHPLLGDELYGGPEWEHSGHALECVALSFEHPMTHKRLNLCIKA